jgi:hypothetical protein
MKSSKLTATIEFDPDRLEFRSLAAANTAIKTFSIDIQDVHLTDVKDIPQEPIGLYRKDSIAPMLNFSERDYVKAEHFERPDGVFSNSYDIKTPEEAEAYLSKSNNAIFEILYNDHVRSVINSHYYKQLKSSLSHHCRVDYGSVLQTYIWILDFCYENNSDADIQYNEFPQVKNTRYKGSKKPYHMLPREITSILTSELEPYSTHNLFIKILEGVVYITICQDYRIMEYYRAIFETLEEKRRREYGF